MTITSLKSLEVNSSELAKLMASNQAYSKIELKSAFFIEPSTIIKIAEVVKEIFGLFKSNPDNEILKEIKNELSKIVSLLIEIIDMIKALQGVIEEDTRKYVVKVLQATIEQINYAYRSWKNDLEHGSRETRDNTFNEINNHYTNLSTETNIAMKYGYQHYNDIALAFAVELQLAKLLNKSNDYIKEVIIKRYLDYFNPIVSDQGISNPPTFIYTLKLLIERNDQLKTDYVATTVSYNGKHSEHCNSYDYTNTLVIKGDVESGFTFSSTQQITKRYPGSRWCNLNNEIGIIASDTNNFGEIMANYNNASNIFHQNLGKIKILNDCIQSVNSYVNVMNELSMSL